MIIFSPHLDDAVFSCCRLLRDATVVTVCAGIPEANTPPTQFDRRAGFTSGAEAVHIRRLEDYEAAYRAGFATIHLDVLDHGYGGGNIVAAVRATLARFDGERIVGPLGLHHPDHVAVAYALLAHADRDHLWLYEDLPYSYLWPDEALQARVRLGNWQLVEDPSPEGKESIVRTYGSQITEHTHMAEILSNERLLCPC